MGGPARPDLAQNPSRPRGGLVGHRCRIGALALHQTTSEGRGSPSISRPDPRFMEPPPPTGGVEVGKYPSRRNVEPQDFLRGSRGRLAPGARGKQDPSSKFGVQGLAALAVCWPNHHGRGERLGDSPGVFSRGALSHRLLGSSKQSLAARKGKTMAGRVAAVTRKVGKFLSLYFFLRVLCGEILRLR